MSDEDAGERGIRASGEFMVTPSYRAKVTTKCSNCGSDVSIAIQPDAEGRSLCISQWEEKDDE